MQLQAAIMTLPQRLAEELCHSVVKNMRVRLDEAILMRTWYI